VEGGNGDGTSMVPVTGDENEGRGGNMVRLFSKEKRERR
jgi:hypothetical protein